MIWPSLQLPGERRGQRWSIRTDQRSMVVESVTADQWPLPGWHEHSYNFRRRMKSCWPHLAISWPIAWEVWQLGHDVWMKTDPSSITFTFVTAWTPTADDVPTTTARTIMRTKPGARFSLVTCPTCFGLSSREEMEKREKEDSWAVMASSDSSSSPNFSSESSSLSFSQSLMHVRTRGS